MTRYLYSELASAIAARRNCETSGNVDWFSRRACIGGLHKGDTVSFFTQGEERKVTGVVTKLVFGEHQGDYAEVHVSVDGMSYTFGTDGHLGQTWTTESESGTEQWFVEAR